MRVEIVNGPGFRGEQGFAIGYRWGEIVNKTFADTIWDFFVLLPPSALVLPRIDHRIL